MRTEIRVSGDVLEVTCSGPYTQADLLAVVTAIAEARDQHHGILKCLMDARNAEFRLGGIGEFFVGEYAAKKLAGMRICLLTAPGHASKFLENAAYNRGLRILVADSPEEAEKWLGE
jgi:hypothetical protein